MPSRNFSLIAAAKDSLAEGSLVEPGGLFYTA